MRFESKILCVFEGEKREPKYFESLKVHFFTESDIIYCCYENDIYELFRKLSGDDDLDIVEIVRESSTSAKNILENLSRDDFGQIFLFFDFEFHDDKFSFGSIEKMLFLFSEETEKGKLFVSYPMIEAIRDIPINENSYIDHMVSLDNSRGCNYKNISTMGSSSYIDPRKITFEQWCFLIELNLLKANYITTGDRDNRIAVAEQSDIFNAQKLVIESDGKMYVLSSFSMFVAHQNPSSLILRRDALSSN